MNATTSRAADTWTPDVSGMLLRLPQDREAWLAMRKAAQDAKSAESSFARALADCLAALRDRATAARAAAETVLQEPEVEVAAPEPPAPGASWAAPERALYSDLLALFELGDSQGAMTSLERLWMLSPDAADLSAFLSKNQDLLIRIYREALGSLDRVPVPRKDRAPVRVPAARPSIMMDVLRLCDGHRKLKEIVRKSRIGELNTLLTVSHLSRSGFVELS